MELIIGTAVAVVSGVTWLVVAAQKREQKRRRRAELTRRTFTSDLTRNRSTVHDQMDRTSKTYLNNVQDTLRR